MNRGKKAGHPIVYAYGKVFVALYRNEIISERKVSQSKTKAI